MKTCIKCNQSKDFNQFNFYKRAKDGLYSSCKICVSQYQKDRSKYRKTYRKNNKKKLNDKQKEYDKTYNLKSPDKRIETNKKSKIKRKNKDKILQNIRYHKKMQENTLFKVRKNARNLITNTFKNSGTKKETKTENILGCTFIEFKEHIEKQFLDWMNWDNHGKYNGTFNFGWDLDHIIPISSAKTEKEIIKLNHYTNFQPLCSKINRYIKGKNINFELATLSKYNII